MGPAESKTPAILLSELIIKAQDSEHSFLLLEGPFDKRFWENRLNSTVLRSVECAGKKNLLDVLDLVSGRDLQARVIALADADFDRLLGKSPKWGLVWTDQNDLEMTLLLLQCSQPVQTFWERLLISSIDPHKRTIFETKHQCSVIEFARRIACQYGVLRYLNEREGWGINFNKNLAILHPDWFDHTTHHLNVSSLHLAVIKQNASISMPSLEAMIQACQQGGLLSDWSLVQGHDFIKVLSILVNSPDLRPSVGHLQWSESSLHRDMVLMHWQDIQECPMVDQLRQFAPASQNFFSY